jgi:ABC-type transport system substrate-binding protein/class 3 adenylate cyclase
VSPVDELPVGTVTFLFTDIEGSTRLLKQLRDRYGEALEEHQRILRETFAAHDGHEIDTQGDSFFVAFRRAKEAVAAAVEGQRRLAEHEWPDGSELRVRMGIHTGEPAAAGKSYVGLGVHRAARISAAGHGGQVLVSQATRELLRDDPLRDVSLRDLGEHQLKDLDEPERIYQLVAPGLGENFPPLKTTGATPFEGREDELAEAAVEKMAAPWRRPGRRTLIAATFGAAVIGVVAGVLLTQGSGSTASASVQPNSVGVISPSSGRVTSTFSAGASPGGVAVGEGATWVTNPDANTVARINAGSNAPNQTYQVGGGPVGVAVGHGSVWVANGLDGTVSRIDPASPLPAQTIHVGNGPIGIAYGARRVWVANSVDGTVSEINPASGKSPRTFAAVPGATGVVFAFQRVWVVSPSTGTVVSLDPRSGKLEDTVHVGVDPVAIAAGNDAIWVANRDNATVTKIAPQSPTQAYARDVIPVGRGPISIATVPGAVWVANGAAGTLMRIDPATDAVVKTIPVANPPQALAGTAAGIYVAVASSGVEHRGGTLRVGETAPDFLDPALAYTPWAWGILSMTNDGLVGFRRVGGIEGVQLVPDLAVSLPAPTDDGRTYTFRLRKGTRYSTGKPVQPADFRTAIERVLEAKIGAPTRNYFLDIVGADRCRPGRPCDLSRGIVGEGRTVTFRLTKADGDFLSKLGLISAAAVPAGTPPPSPEHDQHALPATGPYMTASYRKGHSLTLVRNRYFRQWSADAQPAGYPNRITFSFLPNSAGSTSAIDRVKAGKADIAPDVLALSKAQLERLRTGYPSQLRLRPGLSTDFFFLNTSLPPFDDVRVRRAVNDAFDRHAYKALQGPGYAPTCQVLPPDYPSYRKTCPYESGGPAAVAAARRVVRSAGLSRQRVTVWMPSAGVAQGHFMVHLLDSIGLRAHLKVISIASGFGAYFNRVNDPRTRAQTGYYGWLADYPSDTGFLPPILSCASDNVSRFCDHAIDRLFAKAEAAQAENPAAAPALWQQAERAVLLQAPIVPTDNSQNVAFVAKRVGNFQYHPEWGVLLDQLWVR